MSHSDDKCLFCMIVKGTIPSFKVYETERSLAFLDISPVSEGHTQVIPKYHAVTIADLPDEYLADIGPVVKKVALATGASAYNVLQNNGKIAFQHVDHVHYHVIPKRSEKDGLILDVNVSWPQKKAEKEELAATLENMKARI
ncbi:HIT-like protein [Lentinula raphanica]|uniref:HIT-like protein n=1 Tax=Lentinula raphanica TaxID=153919 RepID=A0AA38P8Q5_9AGAR|nr:HIT-like protein [Lentinula raphanica]KAJ3838418.1 HIT-like protein [Lentinula raphanica]KAJ3971359.1 HIT-like protein [Lentinula raphanica]